MDDLDPGLQGYSDSGSDFHDLPAPELPKVCEERCLVRNFKDIPQTCIKTAAFVASITGASTGASNENGVVQEGPRTPEKGGTAAEVISDFSVLMAASLAPFDDRGRSFSTWHGP
eukprot:s4612_g3.t1